VRSQWVLGERTDRPITRHIKNEGRAHSSGDEGGLVRKTRNGAPKKTVLSHLGGKNNQKGGGAIGGGGETVTTSSPKTPKKNPTPTPQNQKTTNTPTNHRGWGPVARIRKKFPYPFWKARPVTG